MRRLSLAVLFATASCTPTGFWGEDDSGDDTSDSVDPGCVPSDDPAVDTDGDRLPDVEEVAQGTDACNRDSDADGQPDGFEVENGTNPTNDASKLEGVFEIPDDGTSTLELSFLIRIQAADVAFLIDTTGSMGSLATAVAAEFSGIVSDLSTVLPDASYGVATYDDYPYAGYGSQGSGDMPFILRQQQTTDVGIVQTSLSTEVALHYGGDGPESTIEALYQGITGIGYDMDCDKIYDPGLDVPPFRSSTSDPFGGTAPAPADPTTPGGGAIGGFGFRRGALPIFVYGTDAELRNPEAGYGVPPGCPKSAGMSDVVTELGAMGGRVVGIGVNMSTGSSSYTQMQALASATGSVGDINGDGVDEPMVVTWSGWGGTSFRSTVVSAVSQLVGALRFAKVDLDVTGDGAPFVASIDPEAYYDVGTEDFSTPLTFTVHLEGVSPATEQDQYFTVNFRLMGDDAVFLDQRSATIIVPGTGVED